MICASGSASAHLTNSPTRLPDMVVQGREDSVVGVAESATQGTVGVKQIAERPILRSGEILETVPGVIITQHAGGGKANQYFLRVFNLDHGTDFCTSWTACRSTSPPLTAEVLNVLDRRDHDVDYLYESRVRPGDGARTERHFHPGEPIQARLGLTARF